MGTYREITLGYEAIKYIRESLREGNTLASYLLQRLDISKGKVITFLPSYVNNDRAREFKTGKSLKFHPKSCKYFIGEDGTKWKIVPKPDESSWLISIVHAFLSTGKGHLCIFENALARPNDPIVSSTDTRILIFKDEVYHFLSERDVDNNKIRQTIRRAESPHLFIGVMTSVFQENNFSLEVQKITITSEKLLKGLADRTEKIIVSAYDGEGYLIWSTLKNKVIK